MARNMYTIHSVTRINTHKEEQQQQQEQQQLQQTVTDAIVKRYEVGLVHVEES